MREADRESPPFDVLTLAAIGAAGGLALLVTHEVLGHALATVLLGAHLVHLTNVDSSYGGPAAPIVMRTIAAAGITANLIVGWLVLLAARSIPERAFTTRFFAWFFGHATLFMGSSYLAGFAFLPFGDVHAAIQGVPFQLAWQVAFVIAGIVLYRAAFRDARRALRGWSAGVGQETLSRIVLIPYLAMGITNTLAALFNPAGAAAGALWAAAATFGAGYGLVAAASSLDGAGAAAATGSRIPRSGGWIAAGVASTLILLLVLGPGVPR